jgi:hypothetical protein
MAREPFGIWLANDNGKFVTVLCHRRVLQIAIPEGTPRSVYRQSGRCKLNASFATISLLILVNKDVLGPAVSSEIAQYSARRVRVNALPRRCLH